MRAVLTNAGSMGDVQPLLALALELKRNNHEPLLALAPYFGPYVKRLGLEFVPVGPDLNYPELQRRDTTMMMQGVSPLDLMLESLPLLSSMLSQVFEELRDACGKADILISGHLQMTSRMVHELTHIPFVSVQMNHFGGMQPQAFRQALLSILNPFRARYGLPPIGDPIHKDANSPQLALYAISKYFRSPDADWPEHYHVTGFYFLDEKQQEPDRRLTEFLEAGEPPVAITFSSVAHEDPQALTALLLEAIESAGCRAIIQRGWSGLAKGEMPSHVCAVDFVQHTWLFPRAACVVHHGGAGTTASAIRAGTPAVIVPYVGDQPLWGQLARQLGCASSVIPHSELTPAGLAGAISETLNNKKYYEATRAMSANLQAEQGLNKARQLIEQLMQKLGFYEQAEDTLTEVSELKTDRRKRYQQMVRSKKNASRIFEE